MTIIKLLDERQVHLAAEPLGEPVSLLVVHKKEELVRHVLLESIQTSAARIITHLGQY